MDNKLVVFGVCRIKFTESIKSKQFPSEQRVRYRVCLSDRSSSQQVNIQTECEFNRLETGWKLSCFAGSFASVCVYPSELQNDKRNLCINNWTRHNPDNLSRDSSPIERERERDAKMMYVQLAGRIPSCCHIKDTIAKQLSQGKQSPVAEWHWYASLRSLRCSAT